MAPPAAVLARGLERARSLNSERSGSAPLLRGTPPDAAGGKGGSSVHEKYAVVRKLGRGCFATVYLAQGWNSFGEFALKVVDLRGRGDSAAAQRKAQAFVEEAAYLKQLGDCNNIVKAFGAYMECGIGYLILERCSMSVLQALESMAQLTERSIRTIFREMLKGISCVHAANIAHRDIKPDNFLCFGPAESVTVKLCDFGLASRIVRTRGGNPRAAQAAFLADRDGDGKGRTPCGLIGINGTPPFMAPEMLGMLHYGTKVDIWSFGVIFYVLLCGEFPYQPANYNSQSMKEAILNGVPAPRFSPGPMIVHEARWLRPPTKDAVALLRSLINRDPLMRPKAADVIRDSFFCRVPDPGQEDVSSLRPMLQSAKRIGAFEKTYGNDVCTELDLFVAAQQERHREGAGQSLLRRIRASSLSPAGGTMSARLSFGGARVPVVKGQIVPLSLAATTDEGDGSASSLGSLRSFAATSFF